MALLHHEEQKELRILFLNEEVDETSTTGIEEFTS